MADTEDKTENKTDSKSDKKSEKKSKGEKKAKKEKKPKDDKKQKDEAMTVDKPDEKKPKRTRNTFTPHHGRLYAKGVFTGYTRGQRNQRENFALITIDGAKTKDDGRFYVGKKCVYVYKAKKRKTCIPGKPRTVKNRVKAIWGKVTRIHGNSGAVRAKFVRNLPPCAMGRRIRIMMYPSSI